MIALLARLFGGLLRLLGVFALGRRSARQDAALRDAQADRDTMERIADAPMADDADAAARWLRDRRPGQR